MRSKGRHHIRTILFREFRFLVNTTAKCSNSCIIMPPRETLAARAHTKKKPFEPEANGVAGVKLSAVINLSSSRRTHHIVLQWRRAYLTNLIQSSLVVLLVNTTSNASSFNAQLYLIIEIPTSLSFLHGPSTYLSKKRWDTRTLRNTRKEVDSSVDSTWSNKQRYEGHRTRSEA